VAGEYRALIAALEAVDVIRKELDSGTKFFINKKECNDPWKILRAFIEKRDVQIECPCKRGSRNDKH